MEENIEEVEKIEEKIELNYEEREKLKEFLKKNLEIMIGNEEKDEKYNIKEDWKEKFENNKIYNKINIIFDIMWTKSLPYLAFKHSSFDKNRNDLNSLKRSIYPIFYLYTDSKTKENKYLVLAFGRWIQKYDEYSAIEWDKRINSNFSSIQGYFDENKIDINEKNRINSFNFYKLYVIKNNNLSEELDKILYNFEKILKYYLSYIEIYNKLKKVVQNYEYLEEKRDFYNWYLESSYICGENELKNILDYFIEDFKIRYEVKTLEKYEKICRIFEKYLVDRKDNNLKNVLEQFIRHLKMRGYQYEQCIKMLKECNEIYYKFDDDNFKFPLNTILYGNSKIENIMYNSMRYSVCIIQRKLVEDKIILESFKGYFLNGQIKYIPSDEEYSLKKFKEFCKEVKEDKYNNNYVLIFENIDKRDKSKIFGEDFSKLRERICNKEDSELPKNLYILATTSKTSFHIEDIEFFKNFDFEKIVSNDEYMKNIGEIDEKIKEIFKINKKDFKFPLNTILYGPPGTGKTYNSIFYSVGIIKKDKSIIDIIEDKTKNISDIEKEEIFNNFNDFKEQGQIEFVTFHQSYSYEDFVEGIRPTLTTKDNEIKENSEDKKDLKYTIHSGIFKNICERAKNNQDKNYVLIIDEINRGNISKIFGELITLLEPTKRLEEIEELKIRLPYSGEEFGVPKNLYILGTMNTADRSIALLDIALRRRFNFIEMPPKYDLLREKIEVENDKIELQELLKAINNRIEFLLDKDHLIGHSYLVKVETFDDLKEVFRNSIIPLLQEYFYDDFEKIKFVLNIKDDNNNFIIKKEIPKNFSDALKNKIEKKPIYLINEKAFDDHKKYREIYN